jgi:hypothetical protein
MKKLIATVGLLLAVPVIASAQNRAHHYRWQGYSLFGAGAASNGSFDPLAGQVAFGGEGISRIGLGLGLEVGWTHLSRALWLRTPSLGLSYHFPKAAHQKVEPFVQAGATVMYYELGYGRGAAAANVGGGVNLWVTKHIALRWDVRDFIPSAQSSYPSVFEFRIGLAFR